MDGLAANTDLPADEMLRRAILETIQRNEHDRILSTNAAIADVRRTMPSCSLSTERLAGLISEAAMSLGLVPVFNRDLLPDEMPRYGYGHPAHRPDPNARYLFDPGPCRTLPIKRVSLKR